MDLFTLKEFQETYQLTEDEATTRMLVFKVKSSGVFWPGILNSEQNFADVEFVFPSEDSVGEIETGGGRAASPLKASSYKRV